MSDLSRFVAQKLSGEWSAGNVAGVLTDVIIEVRQSEGGTWGVLKWLNGPQAPCSALQRLARRGPRSPHRQPPPATGLVHGRAAATVPSSPLQRLPSCRRRRRRRCSPLPPAIGRASCHAQYLVAGDRWESLDPLVRSRLLLAPLFMRKRELAELRPALEKLAAAGAADK